MTSASPCGIPAAEPALAGKTYDRLERRMVQRQMENKKGLEFRRKAFGGGLLILAAVAALLGYRSGRDIDDRLSNGNETERQVPESIGRRG